MYSTTKIHAHNHLKRSTYPEILSCGSNGCDNIDLLHQEEVDDDLGESIEDDAGKDGKAARQDVAVIGLDQHRRNEREGPRHQIQRNHQASSIVDGLEGRSGGLASKQG